MSDLSPRDGDGGYLCWLCGHIAKMIAAIGVNSMLVTSFVAGKGQGMKSSIKAASYRALFSLVTRCCVFLLYILPISTP